MSGKKYTNLMENLVEEKYKELRDSLSCCTCESCRSDIIAYALNQLPTKYVVTVQGSLYTKLDMLGSQYKTDILSAIVRGSELVGAHPRHAVRKD